VQKLLIVQVAALGWELVQNALSAEKNAQSKSRASRAQSLATELSFQKAESFFPALTCTAQASFRTASPPHSHGMIANGLFFRDLRKVLFWEPSAALVEGERMWEKFRASAGNIRGRQRRVGMMFWQQSLGEKIDLVLSPAPIHKHSGGMIQDCYSQPRELYQRLAKIVGGPFNLINYWGPFASRPSSDWIVDATCAMMRERDLAPELLFSYIPHLDYDLQRHGPNGKRAAAALEVVLGYLARLRDEAKANGYEWLFYGDYAIEAVNRSGANGGAIFPNRRLREAGLFETRAIKKMRYADFFASRAFAMADHQIAHVFTRDENATAATRAALQDLSGVEMILNHDEQQHFNVAHPRSGDLLLIAKPGAWFAYPWWEKKNEAPDFATHVDLRNKPGCDPCELFFGWPPPSVSQNTAKIRGTHGRPNESVAWTTSLQLATSPRSLLDLARLTKVWLDKQL